MAGIPTGQSSNTPLPTGGQSTRPAPGVGTTDAPKPVLPGMQPQGPRPSEPATWNDPLRIMRDLIDLYLKDPKRAGEVKDFVNQKMAEIAEEKAASAAAQ